MRRKPPRNKVRRLARTRIRVLWQYALIAAKEQPSLARRQMHIARKIAQKARIKLPRHMKRHLCKICGAVLIPGENCRVRVRSNRSTHLTVTCLDCGAIRRFHVTRQA